MPLRKSYGARALTASMATGGIPAGFTYLGFAKGVIDPTQDVLAEVSLMSGEASAKTVQIVHYDSAGTVKNDITTASFTSVIGKAFDGTLSTNVVNSGVNLPWALAPGDSVLIVAVSAGSISATFTIYPRGA